MTVVLDTSDWAAIAQQPTANVAVTNTPNVAVSGTPNVAVTNSPTVKSDPAFSTAVAGTVATNVNNTPSVTVGNTVSTNTSLTDPAIPNLGKNIKTTSVIYSPGGAGDTTLVAGVGGQTIQILGIAVTGNVVASTVVINVNDNVPKAYFSWNLNSAGYLASNAYNQVLPVGSGVILHSNGAAPAGSTTVVTIQYTQA